MSAIQPRAAALTTELTERYTKLASCCGPLSCGESIDVAAPAPGETLVDLGCGRGKDVVRAARRVGPSGLAIGLDRNEEMLNTARANVPPDVANTLFVWSDLAAMDLADATADVVVSNCTINHAPDKAAVYREISRILKPGGRFVVSDVIALSTLPDAVRRDPAAWAACYGGAIPEPEYVEAIAAAGFTGIEVLSRTDPYEKGGVLVRSLTVRGTHPGT